MADSKLKELVINECSSVPSTFEPNQLYLTPDTTEEDIANALKEAKEYTDSREQDVRADFADADSELQTQINGQATAITEAQGDIVDLQNNKQDVISDLDAIRSGAGKGSTAVQPNQLSTVATSGSYNDLTNKPTIPSATSQLTNDSDYTTKNYVDTTEQEIIENYMQADTDLQTQITGLSTALTTAQGDITTINGKIPTSASSSNQLITNTELTNATQSVRSDFADADSELQTQITGLSGTVATNQTDIVNLKAQKYGADLSYIDNQLQLLDKDGNALGNSVEISVDTSNAADRDLSNLSAIGQEILDNKLNKQMITNCITEIPQDIKLELNNGTLTLKAGSKVYVPNGVGVFDSVTISNDRTVSVISSNTYAALIYYATHDNGLRYGTITGSVSGSSISITDGYWYDTTNNIINRIVSSAISYSGLSFPIAIISVTKGVITSIDQIFNGFGYIGSTVFALPGVKGLIPNGRNEDGTLKNIEWVNSIVNVRTHQTSDNTGNVVFAFDGENFSRIPIKYYKYNLCENYNYNSDELYPLTVIGEFEIVSGVISNFQPKTPFHGLDYNDKSTIVGWGMPNYSAVVSIGYSYTAPSNGFISIRTQGNGNYFNGSIGSLSISTGGNFSNYHEADTSLFPIKKGDTLSGSGNAAVHFIPAVGG